MTSGGRRGTVSASSTARAVSIRALRGIHRIGVVIRILALCLAFWPAVVSGQPPDASSEGPVEVLYAQREGDEELVYAIPRSKLDEAPRWDPEKDPPPLAIRDAVRIARQHLRASGSATDHVLSAVGLQSVPGEDEVVWYYMLEFFPGAEPPPFYPDHVLVLLDGTVLPPAPRTRVELAAPAAGDEPQRPFHDLPPREMIGRSSAILLVAHREDGDQLKAVVTDVLKRTADTTLHYAVGDEFHHLSRTVEAGHAYGEGSVVFLVGSPASMRTAYSFSGERLLGLGGMSLAELRALAAGE